MPDEPEGDVVWMVPPDLIDDVDQWARERGKSRYEALEELVRLGLMSKPARSN